MKIKNRFFINFLIILSLLFPISLFAVDLNDLAYEKRLLLKAGTILNSEGKGDCLIFPYFDVSLRKPDGKKQVTEIYIENFGEYGIAAKLRFRNWSRGKEVFSKDIWIPSAGFWTGKIEITGSGININAKITSNSSVIWRYDSSYFYIHNPLSGGASFSLRNIKRYLGESTLYGYLEVIGEEKTAPQNINGAVSRLSASEQDCPNTLKGSARIIRLENEYYTGDPCDGNQNPCATYDAVAIGNFSRGQGSLFRSVGNAYPNLSVCEDTLDQLEFQLSKWETIGSFSVIPFNQGKTSLVVTYPTKHFHYKNGRRINGINNPFEATTETGGDALDTRLSQSNQPLPGDSIVTLPYTTNVIGLYRDYNGVPKWNDNVSMTTYYYEEGEVTLTANNNTTRDLIQDFEYFEQRFSTYRGYPSVGVVLKEYVNPDQLHLSMDPVDFSTDWGVSPYESVYTPAQPSGTTFGFPGVEYIYTTGGSGSSLGHAIQYLIDFGDGNNSGWLDVGVTSAPHTYTTGGVFNVKAKARCATHTDVESNWSQPLVVTIESVSIPTFLTGPTTGIPNTSYTFSTGGSVSNAGHSVQYFIDWGDGTDTNWLPVGTTTAAKSWPIGKQYTVKAKAKCSIHPLAVSDWTPGLIVNIEKITTPTTPVGPNEGLPFVTYTYMTGGATSSIGDPVQYRIDWGDGNISAWQDGTSFSHQWMVGGNYSVKAQARCAIHTSIESDWSSGLGVTISNPMPTLTSILPTSGNRLQTLDVVFTGTNYLSGVSSVSFGTGITINSTTVNSPTQITANITITATAATGPRNVSVTNAPPGGGTATLTNGFTVNNPGPTTTSISPTSKTVGDSSFTLTVNGTNFVSTSVVRFNGSDRTTTFINDTQLTATILASDLTTAGTFPITVFNPAPGGGLSNAQTFTVNNPVPITASISPTSKPRNDPGFILTVNGANFVSTSVVRFNGSDRVTTFVSSTQLTAAILASDLTTAGTFQITVFNPAPGGGLSNAQTFTVTP